MQIAKDFGALTTARIRDNFGCAYAGITVIIVRDNAYGAVMRESSHGLFHECKPAVGCYSPQPPSSMLLNTNAGTRSEEVCTAVRVCSPCQALHLHGTVAFMKNLGYNFTGHVKIRSLNRCTYGSQA